MKRHFFIPIIALAISITACTTKEYKAVQAADIPMAPHSVYSEGLIADITPKGWLAEILKRQKEGLSGHPEAMDYPYHSVLWAGELKRDGSGRGDGWWRFEQTAYYLDGLTRLGYLTEDRDFLDVWENNLEYVLAHPLPAITGEDGSIVRPEGRLGNETEGMAWPMAVFFRALKACYEATGDERIPAALEKHFLSYPPQDRNSVRWIVNVEGLLWTYAITGNEELLRIAEEEWLRSNSALTQENCLDDNNFHMHGVTMNEELKVPMLLYAYTGKPEYLQAALKADRKMEDANMLVDGVVSSSEYLAGQDALASHETCDITDYSWTMGYFLMATGDASWADRIERCMFNAAPGCITKDFKSMQYFSCPNQFICTGTSDHNEFKRGLTWMQYRPVHQTECCIGNVHRMFPNYISRMWLKDAEGQPVAALYGPSEVVYDLGDGVSVCIDEQTGYPFDENITFEFTFYKDGKLSRASHDMTFTFRVPEWYAGEELQPGFHQKRGSWKSGDRFVLNLPMKVRFEDNPVSGRSVTRGPLVYSYSIPSDWQVDTLTYAKLAGKKCGNPDFKSWTITPSAKWNYALESCCPEDVEVVFDNNGGFPFDEGCSPVKLRVKAAEVKDWVLEEGRYTPALPDNPVIAAGSDTTIELVPYGSTTIRVTVFPTVSR